MNFRYASSHWPLSVGEQVAEVQAVGQLQHRPPVPIVGPDRAFSTTPHGVTIGPDESGDLRPRQPRLPLEPFQPLREILGEDLGSSTVVCASSARAVEAWHKRSQSTAVCRLLCRRRDPIPVSLIPREVRVLVGAPASPVHTCLLLLVSRYWPGPVMVSSSRLDSILPSSVQIAPSASQSSVTGSTMIKEPSESGVTWISHPILLGGPSRRT